MWERFTERARYAVHRSQEEADRFGERTISTEHLLLALLRDPDSTAMRLLARMDVASAELEAAAEARKKPGAAPCEPRELSPRAWRVLDLALLESDALSSGYVGTEHLLLGLIREEEGLAGRILGMHGVTLGRAHSSLIELLDEATAPTSDPARPTQSVASAELSAVRALLLELRHDGRTTRPCLPAGWFLAYQWIALPILLFSLWLLLAGGNSDGLFVSVALLALGAHLKRMTTSRRQKQAIRKLAALRDKRIIGSMVEFLSWPDSEVQADARDALADMLPRLHACDADLLSPLQYRMLCRSLNRFYARRYPEFLLAVLKALEQIGDEAALPPVRRLAHDRLLASRQPRVTAAARDCLPFLESRLLQQEATQTLLRSAPERPALPDTLLRPVANTSGVDPNQMLRAGQPGAEEGSE